MTGQGAETPPFPWRGKPLGLWLKTKRGCSMAFFTKLRERLTRSSSKIGEGLEMLARDGRVVVQGVAVDTAFVARLEAFLKSGL